MSLPFTTNRFLPINVKGSDAITGTYGGVSILNNGKAELKSDTTIKRLGINGNTNPLFDLSITGTTTTTGLIQTPRITYPTGVSATLLTTQSSSITVASGVMSFTATNAEATFQSFKTQFFGSPFTITSVNWASIANMPINGVWTFYLQNATSGDITIKNNVVSSGTANTYLHTDYYADVVIPNGYNIGVIKIERGETVESYFTAYITSNAIGGVIPSPDFPLPADATFGNLTVSTEFDTSIGSTAYIRGDLNIGSSTSLNDNYTTIYGQELNFNEGISQGKFSVGLNVFQIDMNDSIMRTLIDNYSINTDVFDVRTFDFNINKELDVGLIKYGNDFVFNCVNHTYTDNTLTRNIPNATTTTKEIVATGNMTAKRFILDGKCGIEALSKVNYSTATDYNIEWGDNNTVMVLSSVAQNIFLPLIPADDTKNGTTFRILKATNVNVVLAVSGGSTFETEDNTSVSAYTMVGQNRYIFVTVAFNASNNRIWRIVQSQSGSSTILGTKTFSVLPQCSATPTLPAELITKQYADATYTGGSGSALLSSSNTWTGATNTCSNSLIANNLLPYFSLATSSYKIGLNAMLRQQASATSNIAIGENALLGYATTPAWNQTKRNIAIGFNAGKNLYYDSGTVESDDNVIIGYNAGSNMFYSSRQNVLIGSNCGSSNNYIQKCVFIGHNIASTGPFFLSDSVIIGANSLQSISDKSGVICIGSGNLPVFSGNSPVCIGVNCGLNAGNNNRGIWLGGNCGNNVNSNLGSYFIGNNCGNSLTTGGGSCCFMGNDSNTTNGALTNTFVFGYTAICGTDDTFFIGGINVFSNKTMTPVVRNKNRLCHCDIITTSTLNLNFQDAEYIVLSTNATTTINLPNPNALAGSNIGTKYTIIRAYSPSVPITINATSGIEIQYGNNFSNSMIVPVAFFTIVCINSSGTAWVIVNSQYDDSAINSNIGIINAELTDINGDIDTLVQQTQGIGYTNASASTNISKINTDVDTSPQLTIGYGGTLPSTTTVNGLLSIAGAQLVNGYQVLSGSPNNLAKPLKEYYALSTISTGALTLPVIDSTMYGSQITFVKSSAANTWTINAGSGNTFRLYKSNSTATETSISLALNNTVLRIVATANVWEVLQTDIFADPNNWVVGSQYLPMIMNPTNITAAVNWNITLPATFYGMQGFTQTATYNITLPLLSNPNVPDGLRIMFRRVGGTVTFILNAVASTGNTIMGLNSATATAAGTAVVIVAASAYSGELYGNKTLGRWFVI